MGGELRWFLDRSDPLGPYNRQLALAFLRRQRSAVAEQLRFIPTEGHMVKAEAQFLVAMVERYEWITDIMEIGFNAGHSSYLFLSARPDTRVVSFDLGDHGYIDLAKELIDRRFPGRHQLIRGDSRRTVPDFHEKQPDRRFDLLYIDGGHDYDVAAADIANCAALSTPRSLVVMDDLEPHRPWGVGPVKAWGEAVEDGLVDQELLLEDGFPLVDVALGEVQPKRVVWAVGRYPGASSGRVGPSDV